MPTSAPGCRRGRPARRSSGFTLVELMVVVTVIALASTVAMLAIPNPRGRVFDEAARFATRVEGARDVAIVEGRPVSIWIGAGGYGFDQRRGGAWVPMADKPFRVTRWEDGTRAVVTGPGRARTRVIFDATGLADRPVQVALARARARVTASVGADGQAHVE